MPTTSSKKIIERKYKPWRKGKAAEKHGRKPKKMSAKNRLRGQRRLLAKLAETDAEQNGEAIESIKSKISQLEEEVAASERREREKKNATKYHQIKFIERQKLTRLEKSVTRELEQLKHDPTTSDPNHSNYMPSQENINQLQSQLDAIAMDQLYIAFYPTDMKYMSLFTNGMNRAVDDERGQKRRKLIWNRIREGLLKEIQNDGSEDINEEGESTDGEAEENNTISLLKNAKKWVNLDAAKRALLSMPPDTYPNAPSLLNIVPKLRGVDKATRKSKRERDDPPINSSTADDRFVLSKEQDSLFHESTTGEDYERELEKVEKEKEAESSDASDSDTSSSDDDADPLESFGDSHRAGKAHRDDKIDNARTAEKATRDDTSSSSSSSDSSDSDDEDAIRSDQNRMALDNHAPPTDLPQKDDTDESEDDDFFTTEKIPARDVFAQAQKQQHDRKATDDPTYQRKKSDKSKGFATQNQTKREFRNFQHKKKRSKFG